jgi:hypothetical protein
MQVTREDSVCPRCGGLFHCGVNDDQPCWCVDLRLDGATLAALNERYRGCLCMRCLVLLQADHKEAGAVNDRPA